MSSSCCGPAAAAAGGCCPPASTSNVTEAVRTRYGEVARGEMNERRAQAAKEIAASFGYAEEDLALIPQEANMGVSCGNPTALANLKPGEVVVDLGSGGGMDCFLAAAKVGAEGKVIGVDMTADMIALAKNNAKKRGATNVDFKLGRIESLPLDDEFADVVISNCVINLVPDKKRAFSQIYRVLKEGGRVAISDIALKQPLPTEIKQSVEAFVGCIAGAQQIDEMERDLREAGFNKISIVDSKVDLNVYAKLASGTDSGCCGVAACCAPPTSDADSALAKSMAEIISKINVNDYAMSVKVYAVK